MVELGTSDIIDTYRTLFLSWVFEVSNEDKVSTLSALCVSVHDSALTTSPDIQNPTSPQEVVSGVWPTTDSV